MLDVDVCKWVGIIIVLVSKIGIIVAGESRIVNAAVVVGSRIIIKSNIDAR